MRRGFGRRSEAIMYIDTDDGTAIRCDECDELFTCHGDSIGDLDIASGNAGWLTFMNIFDGRISHYCPKHVYRRTRD